MLGIQTAIVLVASLLANKSQAAHAHSVKNVLQAGIPSMLLTLGEKVPIIAVPIVSGDWGRLATQLDRAGENGAEVSAQRPLRRRTQRPKRLEDYDLTSGGNRHFPADGGQRTVV